MTRHVLRLPTLSFPLADLLLDSFPLTFCHRSHLLLLTVLVTSAARPKTEPMLTMACLTLMTTPRVRTRPVLWMVIIMFPTMVLLDLDPPTTPKWQPIDKSGDAPHPQILRHLLWTLYLLSQTQDWVYQP